MATTTPIPPNATLRLEFIRCGRCPERHGPYWYAYWREGDRLRKRYVGARLPDSLRDGAKRSRGESVRPLKPFFGYFGSKWRLAGRYPAPLHPLIIEPFAGSAGYACLHHAGRRVVLNEKSDLLAGVWRYLAGATAEEVRALPEHPSADLPDAANDLMGFWFAKALCEPRKVRSPWARRYPDSSWWSPKIRERIASQLHEIRGWEIVHGDYRDLPDVEATWFVDPPYQNHGRMYPHGPSALDYERVAEWCRSRRGQVIVCEGGKADWLPFKPLVPGKRSTGARRGAGPAEVWWTNARRDRGAS